MNTFPIIESQSLNDAPQSVCWKGIDILLFRDATRAPHAFQNNCPHQGKPLNDGWTQNSRFVCPWHKWEFDFHGTCQWPKNLTHHKCQTLPVYEHNNWIWIGHPEEARQDLLILSPLIESSTTTLNGWSYLNIDILSPTHAVLNMDDHQCIIRLYTNIENQTSVFRVGIWYPKEWPSCFERPTIQSILDSVIAHLTNATETTNNRYFEDPNP